MRFTGSRPTLILLACFWPAAAPGESLPEPLTLEFALSLAGADHPALAISEAKLALSLAARQAAQDMSSITASVRARTRIAQRDTNQSDEIRDDHTVGLVARKPLLDFGRSAAARSAADAEVRGRQSTVLASRRQRWLDILGRFFDVLLADLRFARDDEAMAIAFVRMERASERNELGQVSDIDLLQAQSHYQQVRRTRYASEAQQRLTRARLAAALNRPGELSSTLILPALPGNERTRPGLDTLEATALVENTGLVALRERMEAARQRVAQARAQKRPVVNAELEGGAQSRKTNSTDRWRAGLTLDIPLTGGHADADIARYQSELEIARAELAHEELRIRGELLEAWLRLDELYVAREEARVFSEYRDLYLDRSRALYENDVRTDLGDAMVQTSDAQLRTARAEFDIALTWAHIDALTGRNIEAIERQLLRGSF